MGVGVEEKLKKDGHWEIGYKDENLDDHNKIFCFKGRYSGP
jgi:hypothetical protein